MVDPKQKHMQQISSQNECQLHHPKTDTTSGMKQDHCQQERNWDPDPRHSVGLVYSPTWMVNFYGFHVGKNTIRPIVCLG